MPGCPPESHQIAAVIDLVIKVLHGEASLPPVGATIGAGISTVCDDCKRIRNEKTITKFTRIQDVEKIDPELCLLEQGIPVMDRQRAMAAARYARAPTPSVSAATAQRKAF